MYFEGTDRQMNRHGPRSSVTKRFAATGFPTVDCTLYISRIIIEIVAPNIDSRVVIEYPQYK